MNGRPILRLKTPPASLPAERWKCRPCGASFEVAGARSVDEVVRCPACNARLGRVGQFRAGGPTVRARRA